jgi:hypothetical protein
MKFHQVLLVALAITAGTCCAQVSQKDTGTYEWLNTKGEPSGVFLKLSLKPDGSWLAEGKLPGKGWENLSCGEECNYRNSTTGEVVSYFPKEWLEVANVSCIQNKAQAFCRAVGKNNPTIEQHLILTLVTGRAIPVILKRVAE